MDRRFVLGFAFVAMFAVGAWALAQAQQPAGKGPAPDGAQFIVAPAGESGLLVDTKTGKTWVLSRAVDGEAVWLPAKRIDSADEAREWRIMQKRIAERIAEEQARIGADRARAKKQ